MAAEAAPDGYYAGKLVQERLVAASAAGWTVQRTTQFHEFAAMLFHRGRAGVHAAPHGIVQPVAASEVAERLIRLAEDGPEFGGRQAVRGYPPVEERQEPAPDRGVLDGGRRQDQLHAEGLAALCGLEERLPYLAPAGRECQRYVRHQHQVRQILG